MSDQSIASIARSLAAALLAKREPLAAECPPLHNEPVEELEEKLCAEYRAEVLETLRVQV